MPLPAQLDAKVSGIPKRCVSWGYNEQDNGDGTLTITVYADNTLRVTLAVVRPADYATYVDGIMKALQEELITEVRVRGSG